MGRAGIIASQSAPSWVSDRLDRHFQLSARGTTVRTELLAALTTFATMSYILAVHPLIMSEAGMDRAQVFTVTALVAGVFSILMGLMANLPIAQAPGMGANALVSYIIVLAMGVPWQAALGLVFWSGVLFLLLTVTGVRRLMLVAYPVPLRQAMTAGIGLFIMFVGLKSAGILEAAPAPAFIRIGDFAQPPVLLSLLGIPLLVTLVHRQIPGAIVLCILMLTVCGMFIAGPDGPLTATPDAVVSLPAGFGSLWLALDVVYLWTHFAAAFPVLLSLVFMDLFSSLAAMNAMCKRAGLVDENDQMLSATPALSADALATIGASLAGTSTTNCFAESAAGIESGGRTGLVAVAVGLMFFASLVISPLVLIIPAQATAPALVFIGILMFTEVREIDFEDQVGAAAAILTFLLMAVTTISDGMAIGLLIYVAGMLLTGRGRQVHKFAYLLALTFVGYYLVAPAA